MQLFSGKMVRTTFFVQYTLVLLAFFLVAHHVWDVIWLQSCQEHFTLLNPRRRCEKDEPAKSQEYEVLQKSLSWRIDEWKKTGKVSHVTVYFRDLSNGPLFGINSQELFAPASLLKVPIMMALFKYSEAHPEILKEELTLKGPLADDQNITNPEETIEPNKKYPILEIVRRMIVYSDNRSKDVLAARLKEISPNIIEQTFIDLGISLQGNGDVPYLAVKSYASLFRALFNASYMNRTLSQQALDVLSQVEFNDGIEVGVPKGTVVAHKFGYMDNLHGEQQLHDCGIVYHPHTPYMLCVMTRGKDTDSIKSVIAYISKAVYDEVSLRDVQ